MRRNRYVVARNRRGMRRNAEAAGREIMKDVVTPVFGGTVGFVASRVVSNALANVPSVRGILDKDAVDGTTATKTKVAAGALVILATLGLGRKVKIVHDHQGAIVTGMGLSLIDRLLAMVTGPSAAYLSGFGEYVDSPLGEYVDQPLGAYVADPAMGEYVDQPLGGMGTMYATAGLGTLYAAAGYAEGVDPANQRTIDGLMDVMEAAAGAPQAAAGMGTLYAAAGLGQGAPAAVTPGTGESDARLARFWAKGAVPFVSTQTPTDVALDVTQTMPFDRKVPDSLVTPEGKGYAAGLFARHLFAGMLSG